MHRQSNSHFKNKDRERNRDRMVANSGEFGRGENPDDIIRRQARRIEALEAENAALKERDRSFRKEVSEDLTVLQQTLESLRS